MTATVFLGVCFVLLLCASAFFSSAETAYFSLDPIAVKRIEKEHPKGGGAVRDLLSQPTKLLSTVLIGNTLVNIVLTNAGYALAKRLVPDVYDEAVSVTVVTVLLLLFGEIGPKNFGLQYTSGMVRLYARPLRGLEAALFPLRWVLEQVSKRAARWMRPAGKNLSGEEFETVLDISREAGVLNTEELAMIKSIMDLEDLRASDVMTPRVDFVGIDLDDEKEEPLEIARKARLNFLILYHGHYDEIAGILDVRQYLLNPERGLQAAMRPATYVPKSIPLNRLLTRFQKERIRIAVVVDEYGGAAGVVTRGDILEEVTGDIYNELSKPRPIFQSAGPHAWLVDANISLEELNRKLRLDLESETSDRLAGWIAEHLGSVPKQDDTVEAQGVRVRVMQTIRLRVTLAHIEKKGGAS